MKKALLSLFTIGVVAVVALVASQAFFNDTETSTGNVLQAGAIDLTIDNESYVVDYLAPEGEVEPSGKLVAITETTWGLRDLTVEKFFNFYDLKPGDWGEDTISVHVDSNDAWACAKIELTEDSDVDYTEPELADDTTVNLQSPLTTDGELPENLSFFWWPDDGDNVLETDEAAIVPSPFFRDNAGKLIAPKLSDLLGFSNGILILADSTYNFFTGLTGTSSTPILGGSDYYVGKAWCFGEMTFNPLDPDAEDAKSNPIDRPGAILCNGKDINNAPQTDRLKGDLIFYAEQSRHNKDFQCTGVEWPQKPHTLRLENKNPQNWEEVYTSDLIYGDLTWAGDGPTFDFQTTFVGHGLTPSTSYTLIYAPDPWPQGLPGTPSTVLGTNSSDASGDLTISGNPNLGYDIPHTSDLNYPTGGKIWLVLSADHDGTKMVNWNPTAYLFETAFIKYNDTDAP